MALRKRDVAVGANRQASALEPGSWGKLHPRLWEMLSLAQYDDGTARVLATLTIFTDAGCVKVCLNDRDQGLTAFASGASLEVALRALEAGLAADSLEWKASQGAAKKRSK